MSELKWVVKTSAVRVASARGDWVYRSLEDVPPALRSKITDTLAGPDSEKIIIANQEAYERVFRDEDSIPERMKRVQPIVVEPKPARAGKHVDWRLPLFGGFAAIFAFWAFWLWLIQSGM